MNKYTHNKSERAKRKQQLKQLHKLSKQRKLDPDRADEPGADAAAAAAAGSAAANGAGEGRPAAKGGGRAEAPTAPSPSAAQEIDIEALVEAGALGTLNQPAAAQEELRRRLQERIGALRKGRKVGPFGE